MEIKGGLLLPVSSEEQELLDLIEAQEQGVIRRKSLDERQRELARKMVSRGALERTQKDGALYYLVNKTDDTRR